MLPSPAKLAQGRSGFAAERESPCPHSNDRPETPQEWFLGWPVVRPPVACASARDEPAVVESHSHLDLSGLVGLLEPDSSEGAAAAGATDDALSGAVSRGAVSERAASEHAESEGAWSEHELSDNDETDEDDEGRVGDDGTASDTGASDTVSPDARASDAGYARASRRRAGIVPDASRGPKPTAHAEHPGRCGEM